MKLELDLAPGVALCGHCHAGEPSDGITPPTLSWVDTDSLQITGRPDLVAKWLEDEGWETVFSARALQRMADRLLKEGSEA